jgi:hypothetical protein
VKRSSLIVMLVVFGLFILSWILKGMSAPETNTWWQMVKSGFLITFSAFLTLAVLSFLYNDNPFYKFAEHLFVGISAAFWMCLGFWSTVVGNLFPRLSPALSDYFQVPYVGFKWWFVFPLIFGVLLLMRLSPKGGWISRWSLAFIVGTTAGLNLVRYLRSDFMEQISSMFVPVLVNWEGFGHFVSHISLAASGQFILIVTNLVILLGVLCGLIYFFFSREHTGAFGVASRFGIWILMITFGASFGYTVMGRISLLVGRITFLLRDWLSLIGS